MSIKASELTDPVAPGSTYATGAGLLKTPYKDPKYDWNSAIGDLSQSRPDYATQPWRKYDTKALSYYLKRRDQVIYDALHNERWGPYVNTARAYWKSLNHDMRLNLLYSDIPDEKLFDIVTSTVANGIEGANGKPTVREAAQNYIASKSNEFDPGGFSTTYQEASRGENTALLGRLPGVLGAPFRARKENVDAKASMELSKLFGDWQEPTGEKVLAAPKRSLDHFARAVESYGAKDLLTKFDLNQFTDAWRKTTGKLDADGNQLNPDTFGHVFADYATGGGLSRNNPIHKMLTFTGNFAGDVATDPIQWAMWLGGEGIVAAAKTATSLTQYEEHIARGIANSKLANEAFDAMLGKSYGPLSRLNEAHGWGFYGEAGQELLRRVANAGTVDDIRELAIEGWKEGSLRAIPQLRPKLWRTIDQALTLPQFIRKLGRITPTGVVDLQAPGWDKHVRRALENIGHDEGTVDNILTQIGDLAGHKRWDEAREVLRMGIRDGIKKWTGWDDDVLDAFLQKRAQPGAKGAGKRYGYDLLDEDKRLPLNKGKPRERVFNLDEADGTLREVKVKELVSQSDTTLHVPNYRDLRDFRMALSSGAGKTLRKVGYSVDAAANALFSRWAVTKLAAAAWIIKVSGDEFIENAIKLGGFRGLVKAQFDVLGYSMMRRMKGDEIANQLYGGVRDLLFHPNVMARGVPGISKAVPQWFYEDMRRLQKEAGVEHVRDFIHLDPTDPWHRMGWYNVVNEQLRSDELARIFIQYHRDPVAAETVARNYFFKDEPSPIHGAKQAVGGPTEVGHLTEDGVAYLRQTGSLPGAEDFTARARADKLTSVNKRIKQIDEELATLDKSRALGPKNKLMEEKIALNEEAQAIRSGKGTFTPEESELAKSAAYKEAAEEKIQRVKRMVESQIPTAELRDLAAAGRINLIDLERIPVAERPHTWGFGVDNTAVGGFEDGVLEKMTPYLDQPTMKLFGVMVDRLSGVADTIARRPIFAATYNKRLEEIKGIFTSLGRDLTNPEILAKAEQAALDYATVEVPKMIHNPSERTVMDEFMRGWMPFGFAKVQFIKRWGRVWAANPVMARRLQLMIGASQESGFIEKDDNGNYVVHVPVMPQALSWVLQRFTGLPGLGESISTIAVGRDDNQDGSWIGHLNKNFNAVGGLMVPKFLPFGQDMAPTFGPTLTFPLAAIAAAKPSWEKFYQSVFGDQGATYDPNEGFVNQALGEAGRSWMSDASRGIKAFVTGDEGDRLFANAVTDTIRWMAYNNMDPKTDKNQKKARHVAEMIFMVRAVAKFFSPYSIPSHMPGSKLSDDWANMETKYGPEVALDKFINKYGEKAIYYVGPKSKMQKVFYPTTKEGQAFYDSHKDLYKTYPDAAGFFSEDGSTHKPFSFGAYRGQLANETRTPLTPEESMQAAHIRAGNSVYFEHIKPKYEKYLAAGYTASDLKPWLEKLKDQIDQKYPGWKDYHAKWSERAEHRKNTVEELRTAMNDPSVTDSTTAQASRAWFKSYDRALNVAHANGYQTLDAKALAPYRDWLKGIAKKIDNASGHDKGWESIYNILFQTEIEGFDAIELGAAA